MMIELRDVWHSYGVQGVWVLKGVSATFREGEQVLVVGHNGSGKTTLLKIASLLMRPTRGRIAVDGEDFWAIDAGLQSRIRRSVVYVHEKPIMLRGTAVDNVLYPLTVRGVPRDRALAIAMDVLRRLGIEDLASANAKRLSAGQSQLVSIARALAAKPRILFLDEPFAHLDREKRAVLAKVLAEEAELGTGIVLTSHSIEYADMLKIDRVLVMENGSIAEVMEKRW